MQAPETASFAPGFPDDTFITTSRGLVKIQDIRIGDQVLTHRGRYRPIKGVITRLAETVILKGQGHHGLTVAADAQFQVRKRSSKGLISDTYNGPATDIDKCHWASVVNHPAAEIPPIVLTGRESVLPEINAHLFWLIGAYLGDGWPVLSHNKGHIVYSVNADKAELIKIHLQALGMKPMVTKDRSAFKLTIYGRAFAKWIEAHFGKGSGGKRIPMWVYGIDREFQEALFDGYVAMDGTPMKNGIGSTISTVSRELAFGFKTLAISLGYASSLEFKPVYRKNHTINGRPAKERPYYRVSASTSTSSSFEREGLRFGYIRQIKAGDVDLVHSLDVAEDHSFIADGIVVENPLSRHRCDILNQLQGFQIAA